VGRRKRRLGQLGAAAVQLRQPDHVEPPDRRYVEFASNLAVRRNSEARERFGTLLLEQYAQVVALSEDFRNRVWEERNNLNSDVVAQWDLPSFRLAEARVKILCRVPSVLSALHTVNQTGIALGRAWRLSRTTARK
jgi:hypothetical protein